MGQLTKTTAQIDTSLAETLDNQPQGTIGWDDFGFSVGNLRINPSTSKPDYDYTEGEFLFDPSSTETVVGKRITLHSYKVGAGVTWKPHVHWLQSQAGVVKWQLQYKITPANGAEGSYTTLTTVTPEFTYTSGILHQISHFPDIDMSAYSSSALMVTVKVSRLGADAADTYPVDCRFLGFDFHVPIDQPRGSRQEFIK